MLEIPYKEIVRKIKKKKGLSSEEINKGIDKIRKKYKGFVKKKSLAVYLLAKELGVKVEVETILTKPPKMTVAEVLANDYERNIDTEGYIIRCERGLPTRTGGASIAFSLADTTGTIFGKAFGESVVEWSKMKIGFGDFVSLKNAGRFGSENYTMLTVGDYTETEKVEPEYNLDELIKSYGDELDEGDFVKVKGVVLGVNVRSYIGCPLCNSKIRAKENHSVKCKKCNTKVDATSLSWKRVVVTDGGEQLIFSFSPSQDIDVDNLVGKVMRVYGIFRLRGKEITVTHYTLGKKLLKKHKEYFKEKEAEEVLEEIEEGGLEEEGKKQIMNTAVIDFLEAFNISSIGKLSRFLQRKFDLDEDESEELVDNLVDEGILKRKKDKVKLT